MSKSITLQRIANGVICIPEGGDLSGAHAFTDILSTSGQSAEFLAYINAQLSASAPPTPEEIGKALAGVSETLTPEAPAA